MRSLARLVREAAGTTLVEFALTAPLVLLLLIATLDFGRALNAYVTVSNASREGLRYAALNTSASADVTAEVAKRVVPLDTSKLTVTAQYSNDGGATWVAWATGGAGAVTARSTVVRVSVSYPWSAVTALTGAFFGGGSGSATFTTEARGYAESTRQ